MSREKRFIADRDVDLYLQKVPPHKFDPFMNDSVRIHAKLRAKQKQE